MRFKIGSMVEVLSTKDLSDVWRCAKIVADDGDGYTVKYYRGPGIAKNSVDKVQSKSVRPCPKPATGSEKWATGDVVEVLDDGYWRVSVIEEVLEGDHYYIRVIGSLDEFMAHNTNIRSRKVWTENKWVLKDKDTEYPQDLTSRMHKKACVQSQFSGTKVQGIPGSGLLSNALKRSSPDHPSTDEAHSGCVQKRRFVDDAWSFVGKIDHPTKETTGTNKELSRHVSLTATILKLMLWLAASSIFLRKGHDLHWLLENEANACWTLINSFILFSMLLSSQLSL